MTCGLYAFGYILAGFFMGAAVVMGLVDHTERGHLQSHPLVVMLCALMILGLMLTSEGGKR